MGFFDKLKQNNAEMIEWQNIVMHDNSTKLYANRKQLEAATIQMVKDNMRIFDDSAHIINSTTKPDVFFSRLQLAEEKLEVLVSVEPFFKYVKAIELTDSLSGFLEEM